MFRKLKKKLEDSAEKVVQQVSTPNSSQNAPAEGNLIDIEQPATQSTPITSNKQDDNSKVREMVQFVDVSLKEVPINIVCLTMCVCNIQTFENNKLAMYISSLVVMDIHSLLWLLLLLCCCSNAIHFLPCTISVGWSSGRIRGVICDSKRFHHSCT